LRGEAVELRLLEYFVAVCEELHFTRAAEKLGISQPTLSQQIRQLEQRMGTPLFRRIGKKTYLTEAGDVLLKHGLKVFHELEQAKAAIDQLRGMQRGRLRIGCSGNHLLTSTIAAFHERYPGIELSVHELATEETQEGLLHNQLDIGVVFLTVKDDLLDSIPLYREELQLVVSSDHSLAMEGREEVPLSRLQLLPIVLLQTKFHVRRLFDRSCRESGFTVKPVLELSTLDSLLQAAVNRIGGAILPKSYVDSVLGRTNSVHRIRIVDPVPHESVGIVYRKETFMCASIDTFISQLANQYSKKTG
jgi:DNA-binding transcriptional LysR family regulator